MNEFFNDVMAVWEMRGNYPNINHFEGIDIAELTKGDDDPFFLTIPIGEVNSTSGNKRFYDDAWITELARQVQEKRPIGIMGHLKESELGTAFPVEAVHWVGVERVNEMLWGKGYVPPGEARERIRRYKATNKKIATSIFAEAKGVWDGVKNAYRMVAETLNLKQIDIGPADRVGIPSLASIPLITAEMTNEDNSMDKVQIIREMTLEDVALVPKAVQDAIKADVPTPKEVELVAELRSALGADENANLVTLVTEMKTKQAERAQREIEGKITELVNEGIKVEPLRPMVLELVKARQPKSLEDVAGIYQSVVEMDSVKTSLETFVQGAMGKPQGTPVQGKNGQSKYFNIPKGDK